MKEKILGYVAIGFLCIGGGGFLGTVGAYADEVEADISIKLTEGSEPVDGPYIESASDIAFKETEISPEVQEVTAYNSVVVQNEALMAFQLDAKIDRDIIEGSVLKNKYASSPEVTLTSAYATIFMSGDTVTSPKINLSFNNILSIPGNASEGEYNSTITYNLVTSL